MSEKVKISREVANSIKSLREYGYTDFQMVFNLCNRMTPHEELSTLLKHDVDILVRAIYIGYEVEQTPTEQAIQWMIKRKCLAPGFSEHDIVMAVKSILERKGEHYPPDKEE